MWGLTLQKFSGNYLTTLAQRDFNNTERDLVNEMTGNIPDFMIQVIVGLMLIVIQMLILIILQPMLNLPLEEKIVYTY